MTRITRIVLTASPWVAALVVFVADSQVFAQKTSQFVQGGQVTQRPIILLLGLAGMGLAPLVVVLMTSFVKIAVVMAIVRQAIGTPQLPPTQIITGLSVVLTIYIMTPVGLQAYHNGLEKYSKMGVRELAKALDPKTIVDISEIAQQPVRDFLSRNGQRGEKAFFFELGQKARRGRDSATLGRDDFAVLTPAFVMSELKEAFMIGFVLFMPFLVLDMVVANILMALGMQMLSPTTVSLPFKILLFVLVDGWHMLSKGLVLGYV